jgi:hypothetical protein
VILTKKNFKMSIQLYISEVKIAVNLENQHGFFSLTSGVRVVVHAKDTLALAYEEGVTIKGGDEAFIRIKLVRNKLIHISTATLCYT